MPTYSFSTMYNGVKRPSAYGDISIEYETLSPGTSGEMMRPVLAHGYICPPGTTSGRKGAPEPLSGFRIGMTKNLPKKALAISARNTGRSDIDKGHIFALELGGPDVPANICPQFSQFQRNGEWRAMEIEALAFDEASDELVFMSIAVAYGQAKTRSRALVPAGFLIELIVDDGGTRTLLKSYQIYNAQDSTDDMMAYRLDSDIEMESERPSHEIVYGQGTAQNPFDRPVIGVQIGNRPNVQHAMSNLINATPSILH